MKDEHYKKWIEENLLTPKEAMSLTKQSRTAFNQSVATGKLSPFISKDTIRLFLKREVEEYAKNKKI